MSAIVVAVGVASAYVSYESGKKAAAASDRATQAGSAANQANLEFQMQQYADWQAVYGPIQQRLSSFYQNLSQDQLVASGLQAFEAQHQATQHEIRRSFAQRGVDSPAMALLEQQDALSTAESKAALRARAPLILAEAQQGFVSGGRANPQGSQVGQAYTNQANAAFAQASSYANNANASYGAAGQALGTAATAAATHYQATDTTVN